MIPLLQHAAAFSTRPRIATPEGLFSAADLLAAAERVAGSLLRDQGEDLKENRVALLSPPTWYYLAGQWGIWRAGGVVVPLCPEHPPAEMAYILGDSKASAILSTRRFQSVIEPLAQQAGVRLLWIEDLLNTPTTAALPDVAETRRALMLYTSGTTSKPKGVVTTHANIAAQVSSLIEAWAWTEQDCILNFLPLHHIHGVINIISCALWSGARLEMIEGFNADVVWNRITSTTPPALTLFMAVPTIYSRLITAWEKSTPAQKQEMTQGCERLRLMVSGSAALPVSVLDRWKEISSHTLLERYGMTEIGMALSNPLRGQRKPGHVGPPLPGMQVRLVDEQHQPVSLGNPGEIQVKGPGVFGEYWMREKATQESFVDGWFRTGDVAVCDDEGYYRILGRSSIDIIKTGGYKVSALEIEEVLREHPCIDQCAVVGLDDAEWGQRVAVAIVCKPEANVQLDELRTWAKQRLAHYKVPSRLICTAALPRNAMGKVVKPELAKMF